MSKFNIPDFNVVYDNFKSNQSSNTAMLKSIISNYGSSMKKWGGVFELSELIVSTLIAIESGGKKVGRNSAGAIGVMQVKEITVRECVSRFKNFTGENIPDLAYNEIKAKAPYLLKLTANQQKLNSKETQDLESILSSDTDFNIMIGCLCFRVALEATKVFGLTRMNKAIIAYNTGVYGAIRSKYSGDSVSTMSLYKDRVFSKETRDYLSKSLGKYGFIQLYNKNF
jgi:soluble lytic murein transglycosylase-like protein